MKKLKNNTDMFTLNDLNKIITNTLLNYKFDKEPIKLYEPINYILNAGGKRIRPVLTLAACNVFSDSIEKAINPAMAVEIFHNFTLIHDDIMDNADVRRGKETVHKRWNSNIAILSGDAMTIAAYQKLSDASSSDLPKILNIFNAFAIGICEGQQYDMDFESRIDVSRDEYLKMVELKTAVLLRGALQIGAVVGGASDDDVAKIGEFGRCLGIAFQLQDDLLDSFGDTKVFGKNIGGDIVANKKTILTIETLNVLKDKEIEEFKSILSNVSLDRDQKVALVLNIYKKANIKNIVDGLINNYFNQAIDSLEKISVSQSRKVVLVEISNMLMNRCS